MQNKMHTCKETGIMYVGTCPLKNCPANLAKLTKNINQGCYFDITEDTTALGIANALKMNMQQFNNNYNAGIRELERVILPLLGSDKAKDNCKECGWSNCKGGKHCKDRKEKITKLLTKYPFYIKEFNFSPAVIWKIAKVQSENCQDYSILDENFINFYKFNVKLRENCSKK